MRKFSLLLTSALIYLVLIPHLANNAYAQQGQIYGPIQSGDRLWTIGNQVRPTSVTQYQAILALLRANPHAFRTPCNMNSTLEVGEYLNVPPTLEMQAISRSEAFEEFKRQDQEWKNRRQHPIVCPEVVVDPPEIDANPSSPETTTSAPEDSNETPTEESASSTRPPQAVPDFSVSAAATDLHASATAPNTASGAVRVAHTPDNTTDENTSNTSQSSLSLSSPMMIAIFVVCGLLVVILMIFLHRWSKKTAEENEALEGDPIDESPWQTDAAEKQSKKIG